MSEEAVVGAVWTAVAVSLCGLLRGWTVSSCGYTLYSVVIFRLYSGYIPRSQCGICLYTRGTRLRDKRFAFWNITRNMTLEYDFSVDWCFRNMTRQLMGLAYGGSGTLCSSEDDGRCLSGYEGKNDELPPLRYCAPCGAIVDRICLRPGCDPGPLGGEDGTLSVLDDDEVLEGLEGHEEGSGGDRTQRSRPTSRVRVMVDYADPGASKRPGLDRPWVTQPVLVVGRQELTGEFTGLSKHPPSIDSVIRQSPPRGGRGGA